MGLTLVNSEPLARALSDFSLYNFPPLTSGLVGITPSFLSLFASPSDHDAAFSCDPPLNFKASPLFGPRRPGARPSPTFYVSLWNPGGPRQLFFFSKTPFPGEPWPAFSCLSATGRFLTFFFSPLQNTLNHSPSCFGPKGFAGLIPLRVVSLLQ